MITTTSCPTILQHFNPLLLMTQLERIRRAVDIEIIPRSVKKIRKQDTGKRKQFESLLKEFEELYGRKKKKEEDYSTEIRHLAERSRLSNAGSTMRFKRFED